MKKNVFHLAIVLVSLISLDLNAQVSHKNNREINVQEYLTTNHLNIEVKEYFLRQIQKTELVKPIDNHEFVHFFLEHYDNRYKGLIKTYFNNITTISRSKIESKANNLIVSFAQDFNEYKKVNPNTIKKYNSGVNMRHYDIFDLGNRGAKDENPNNKGPGDQCNNPDFETGDATGWDLTDGEVDGNPWGYINVTATGLNAQHTIMTGGNDPVVGAAIPCINPNGGGAYSLKLGDGTGANYGAAGASQTFLVDANSESFTYSYALVMENPDNHSLGEKPFFKINMYDQAGNSIACGDYQVISGPVSSGGDPDYVAYSGGFYLPWRTTFAPLQGYVGQNVTIEFIMGDCGQGAHYGYGYIDASCQPLEIIPSQTVICGGNPVTLTAPPGAASYLWSPGGQTTQTITTNVPGNYSVDVTPVTGAACGLTLTATIGGSPDFPVAEFNANPTTVCVGVPVNFNNTSYVVGTSAIDSVEWDFDSDGTIDDTNFNTSYTYLTAGNYTVTLVVYNNGCVDDTTIVVNVSAQPTAAFTFTNECYGTITGFTDLSNPNGGTISGWDWDFDNNGVVDNSIQNPSNGYPAAGTYTAELLVTTVDGCSDSVTMQVVVDPIPVANFTSGNVCLNATTIFNDLSTIITGNINSWAWDFGDASGTSVSQNPTYVYGAAGNYNVTLTVISDSGCIHSFNTNLDVFPEPIAAFTANDVCENVAASFTDNSNPNGGTIAFWNWDFDNNGTIDNTNQNPMYSYPANGTYNIELIVTTSSGCSDTIIQPVTIFPMPIADYTFVNTCFGTGIVFTDNSSVTSGNITNWSWNFGNANTSAIQNPTENYLNDGVYNVQLVATSDNGCKDSLTQQIEVWPLPIVNFNPTEVCLNDTTQFNDMSVVSSLNTVNNVVQWNWNFNGLGSSNLQNPSHVFNVEGAVPTTLTVTTNNGCIDSITINVIVDPLPVINFGPNIDTCAPVCITLDNTTSISSGSIVSYQWDFGDGSGPGGQNPYHCFENYSRVATQTYDVSLSAVSDKGCSSSSTVPNMVTVYPVPLADFIIDPEMTDVYDREISFFDISEIASTWDWDLGDGTSSILTNPVHEYADSGSFIVSLYIENVFGCKDTVIREVRIRPAYAVWISNAFTPDGDGINDEFFIDGFGLKEVELRIYDRWGVELFYKSGNNTEVVWQGDFKGELVQNDVYVYKASVRNVFNEWHDFIGKVTLLK